MKKIWREKKRKFSRTMNSIGVLRFFYITFLILSFVFFSLYARVTGWLFTPNKIDIFHDLDQIAFYFRVVDPELSKQLLTLQQVIQAYLSGENVLQTKENEIDQLRTYAKDHKNYLTRIGFSNYERILQMLSDAWEMREEIYQLLGKYQNFNYLIPLQNSNEVRPNGGFFGSFAFVGLSGGHIQELQVVDSYLPDYIAPTTRIQLPKWMGDLLGGQTVWFIAGNKFGFTDKDWKNLKTLYEKIFHTDFDPERKEKLFNLQKRNQLFKKDIKGVLFLDSELISYLLPSFRDKAWEWQFVNANIDLIRWEARSNKKELYIKDLELYLKNNALRLASATINNVQALLHKWYINIYLSNVSPQMRWFLQSYDLTTVYDSDFAYFWNINTAYNKSDGFLKKQIEIQNKRGTTVLSTDQDKLDIKDIPPGQYTISITYTLDVPKTYQDQMLALESKYGIKMTDREKYILALQDKPADPNLPLQWWSTRELMYLPHQRKIEQITWDMTQNKVFNADFAQGVSYISTILTNPKTNIVKIQFTIVE